MKNIPTPSKEEKSGDASLVTDIAHIELNGKEKHFYSFANADLKNYAELFTMHSYSSLH